MKIALIGASGFIGSALRQEALARGHQVTALVSNPARLAAEPGLTAQAVDVIDSNALARQFAGHDLAISAFSGHAQADVRGYYGRGIQAIVERCCAHARRFAERLSQEPNVVVLNDVVLNQVLVRFLVPGGSEADHDARTRAVITAIQKDGTCWMGGSNWRGKGVMRISVSDHSTTADDVERSIEAVLQAARRN